LALPSVARVLGTHPKVRPGKANELFTAEPAAVEEYFTHPSEESMPTKTTDGKAGAKKPAAKTAAKTGGTKPNALQKPLQPSKELAAIVGSDPLPRGEVVSKMWDYIKKNNLQNPENKREILADDKLKPIFGKPKVTMFEMNKHLAQHLK
jgi:upstream activation factor subunit UAF30